MKTKKILSFLTSAAVAGTLAASVLPFNASALSKVDEESTAKMSLKADTSSFSMEEVAAGNAKTRVGFYVENLDEAEKVTGLLMSFKASNSDYMKLSNIVITGDKDNGNEDIPGLHNSDRNEKATTAKRRYFTFAADEENMAFIIQTSTNWLVVENPNATVVTFDVEFATNTPAGTYTIDYNPDREFVVTSGNKYNGNPIVHYENSVLAQNNFNAATITIGDSAGSSDPDFIPGDVSRNGKLDMIDVIKICKYVMGMIKFNAEEMKIADYNGDKNVNILDAIGVAKELMK